MKTPVAMRHSFDGYGWLYIDKGSGSDWMTRYPDAEPLFDIRIAAATPPVALTPLTLAERAMLHDAAHIINRAARTKGDHWDCVGSLLTRIADHGITAQKGTP